MGVRIYKEVDLKEPIMLCGWPGIGRIGLIAIDTLREQLQAEELGEIEPQDFFYPTTVTIEDGVIKSLTFPRNKFYFKKTETCDLLFFIGDEQPSETQGGYARGEVAYQIARMVIETGLKYGVKRIYTSGAAVAQIHHASRPRVWAVPNTETLIREIKQYENTVLMSEVEGRGGQGTITGLNGLTLGVARIYGIAGICLMGEIPYYLQWLPIPWPKGSKAVLEVLSKMLHLRLDLSILEPLIEQVDRSVDRILNTFLDSLPTEVKEKITESFEQLKDSQIPRTPISDEEIKWFREHSDEFFREFFQKESGK
ncbi:MAG: PAC2 family protein [candidate division WOR-3 bacterium]